mmetsp:Transcript_6870/g.19273  ORF Transcript_6870/g.19273 Transcript_6870/m.19273 type:complete len:222 (-) Transcript_6870:584-1249(-)
MERVERVDRRGGRGSLPFVWEEIISNANHLATTELQNEPDGLAAGATSSVFAAGVASCGGSLSAASIGVIGISRPGCCWGSPPRKPTDGTGIDGKLDLPEPPPAELPKMLERIAEPKVPFDSLARRAATSSCSCLKAATRSLPWYRRISARTSGTSRTTRSSKNGMRSCSTVSSSRGLRNGLTCTRFSGCLLSATGLSSIATTRRSGRLRALRSLTCSPSS